MQGGDYHRKDTSCCIQRQTWCGLPGRQASLAWCWHHGRTTGLGCITTFPSFLKGVGAELQSCWSFLCSLVSLPTSAADAEDTQDGLLQEPP